VCVCVRVRVRAYVFSRASARACLLHVCLNASRRLFVTVRSGSCLSSQAHTYVLVTESECDVRVWTDFREDVSPDKEARSGSIDLRRRGRRPPPNRSPLALRGNLSGGARSGLSRHHGGGLGRNGGVIGVRASRGGREELGMEDESASLPVLPQVEAPLESAEMGPRSASPGQVDVVDA